MIIFQIDTKRVMLVGILYWSIHILIYLKNKTFDYWVT
jgi:hypothetical protein